MSLGCISTSSLNKIRESPPISFLIASVTNFAKLFTTSINNFSASWTTTLTSAESAAIMASLYLVNCSIAFALIVANTFLKVSAIFFWKSGGNTLSKSAFIFLPNSSNHTFTFAKSILILIPKSSKNFLIFTPRSTKNFLIFCPTILNQSPILLLTFESPSAFIGSSPHPMMILMSSESKSTAKLFPSWIKSFLISFKNFTSSGLIFTHIALNSSPFSLKKATTIFLTISKNSLMPFSVSKRLLL